MKYRMMGKRRLMPIERRLAKLEAKEKPSLGDVHYWMSIKYGKANRCENTECPGLSTRFHWAKLKGKLYELKRNCFWQLCASCHQKYDMTILTRFKMKESKRLRLESMI